MSAPDDPEPTSEEHRNFYEKVADRLDALLDEHQVASAAYVRGDSFCDRSEQMLAYGERFAGHATVLVRAVLVVQACLREHARWRVIFPLGEGPEVAIVIYPDRIFYGPRELDGPSLREVIGLYVAREAAVHRSSPRGL